MGILKFERIFEQGQSAIRALIHSRPLSFLNFVLNIVSPSSTARKLMWEGTPFHYRPGTSDVIAMLEILLPVESRNTYRLDYNGKAPAVIFDIGANIGVSAVFFANKFPTSIVHAFEPEPTNYEFLCKNTRHLKNVITYPFGLGSKSQSMPIYKNVDPRNAGGFSLIKDSIESSGLEAGFVEVRRVAEVIQSIGIPKIDLIKIDTEGAEFDILTSIPPAILDNVQWIVGELHSVRDWELLEFLSQRFEIGMTRFRKSQLSLFQAYRAQSS